MKFPRRRFLNLAAGAAGLPVLSRIASAQTYPSRPVHLIVGYTAGGPTDVAARLIGQWLSERLGQPFVIENRPGAGTNIATEMVVRAPADGYTLLLISLSNSVNATLYDKLTFNFIRDIAPVAGIMHTVQVMVVSPSFPAKTLPEFIAYAKANPGKINMATAGSGSPPHIYGELFNTMAGVNLTPVAYRGGGPALVDLFGGQVQVLFESILTSMPYIKAGNLRPLAVTSATRSAALPDVPTVGEFVPGYEAGGFYGVGAPKDTPTEIIDMLDGAINAVLADPKNQERMVELGGVPMPMTSGELSKLIVDETEKWGKVVRTAGMKAD
jgi:tripartite-type tricarboxylate transporter receptor subunit TctC